MAKKWMPLDNAAKIYPVSRSRGWMALFRLSATMDEVVRPKVLEKALERTLRRFPAFSQRLKSGFFWNYFEKIEGMPALEQDVLNPCLPMDFKRMGGFMFRVRYHDKRIAVEFFHALTDGTGALCFLKTLVAEYLTFLYGITIPRGNDILDCEEAPKPEESEDGFWRFASNTSRSRSEQSAFRIRGTTDMSFMHIIAGTADVGQVLALAKQHGVTLTEFLTAILIVNIDELQSQAVYNRKRHKPIKVCIPMNLRRYYPTNTMRNFASYTNPGIEPRFGKYTLEEALRLVHAHMVLESDEKRLNAKFSTNVLNEKNLAMRVVPMLLKRPVMKIAFKFKGDRQSSTTLSNLGVVKLPPQMQEHVARIDFMIGPLSRNRVALGVISYDSKLVINFTRTIRESELERLFFTSLVKMGVHVTVESNQRR